MFQPQLKVLFVDLCRLLDCLSSLTMCLDDGMQSGHERIVLFLYFDCNRPADPTYIAFDLRDSFSCKWRLGSEMKFMLKSSF